MNGKTRYLAACSAGHFWVDFSCALLMFTHLFHQPEWSLCVLLYNFCAFALQMPLGILADRFSRNSLAAGIGCVLVGVGWLTIPIPVLAAVLAGVGNACFHIGGGLDVLNEAQSKSAALGIFVSPGAMGIWLGTLLGRGNGVPATAVMVGLVLFGFGLPLLGRNVRGSWDSGNCPWCVQLSGRAVGALACCFIVVVLRSWIGMVMHLPWKTGVWSFVVVCAVVAGKAVGGILGDRIGMRWAAAFSLGGAAVLFLLSGHPFAGTAAVLLFNMTMPVTLWAAARILPGGKGLAFGALTFALFLGFLPAYLGWTPAGSGAICALGAVVSLVLLLLGLPDGTAPPPDWSAHWPEGAGEDPDL